MERDIAIVGAGIGGLTAALSLARDGHRVTLVERFDQPRPVGSGLVIQPVGLAVLDHLGAGDDARALSSPIRRMWGDRAPDGRRVLDVHYPDAAPGRALHRASLFSLLWHRVRQAGIKVVSSEVVTSSRLVGRGRSLLTENTELGPFDYVVNASGAGSRLSPIRTRPLGYGAIWGTVPWPADTAFSRDMLRQRYRRADRMLGILPVGHLPDDPQPLAALFWSMPVTGFAAWQARPLDDWKAEAVALWPEIAPFLHSITRHEQMTPASYSHGSLWYQPQARLVHIGDAAHRASPQLGQGANMVLLDAHALAIALRGPLDAVQQELAAMRRWHVRSYQIMSAALTPLYQSDSRILPVLRDRLLAPVATWPGVRSMLTRLVSGDLLAPVSGERFP